MDWTEIGIKVSPADLDTASAIATAVSHGGLFIEDYSDMLDTLPNMAGYDYIADALLKQDTAHSVIHIYLAPEQREDAVTAFLKERLSAASVEYQLLTSTVRENDWAESWKQYYHTQKIGKRLIIRPSWEEYTPLCGEAVVVLDPGMSFGTGEHETTRLCLRLLEEIITGGERMLDAGTGSGILSIAALKLGAASVYAVDIETTAVAVARENAAINGIDPCAMTVAAGNLLEPGFAEVSGKDFDVIAANIVADVIIPAASVFYGKLKDGGTLLASGIIGERGEDVQRALQAAGFRDVQSYTENDWTAMKAHR